MNPLPHSLDRSLVIRAPRDVVFRYFADAERFAQWWGVGSSIEGRVGGAVHIVYPDHSVAGGVITRFEPVALVAFTYGYADSRKGIGVGSTLVTITLAEHRDGTLLTLQHDLATARDRDQHVAGWRFQLALFANVVTREQHAGAGAMADRWFQAWGEADPAARLRLLQACTADDVTMQDGHSCLEGRNELDDHIRMSQMFMPGVVLRRDGEPRQCQGTALIEWNAADAAGNARGRGANVVRFAADGRIAGVVGLS